MDKHAASIQYVIVKCKGCDRELAVAASMQDEDFLCADCDRPLLSYLATEAVLPIEDDCE